jgi:hypothetical protein
MVCVLVPLLLKRNVGVLFEVLRGPHTDATFLPCYGSAIIHIMVIIYIYIYL